MNILIIGSKGFIGSHLKTFFLEKNYTVYHADVVVDYSEDQNYFLIDVSNANFKFLFESVSFDFCINCSGAASVPQSIDNPSRDFALNTSNVFLILDAIRSAQPKCKFVNFSSAAVYGNPTSLPIREDHRMLPVSPYGEHKLMSELICAEFWKYFGIHTCSLRVFSAYGEGLTKQLFWDVSQKAMSNKTIDLYGTGRESRDFIYIEDLAYAVHCVMMRASFTGEPINIANGSEVSIGDAVHCLIKNYDLGNEIVFGGQQRKGDPLNWKADVSLLHSFGYTPKFAIDEGLKNYAQWYLEQKNSH